MPPDTKYEPWCRPILPRPLDDTPPEFAADDLVTAFERATRQLEAALHDPAMRRLLLANQGRILEACGSALAIEDDIDREGLRW